MISTRWVWLAKRKPVRTSPPTASIDVMTTTQQSFFGTYDRSVDEEDERLGLELEQRDLQKVDLGAVVEEQRDDGAGLDAVDVL